MSSDMLEITSTLKMPLTDIPIKMVLLRLQESVLLISPLPKLESYLGAIKSFGIPTDIIAPNGFHHLGINGAARCFPEAKLWCAPTLQRKRRDVSWDYSLRDHWRFSSELVAIPVEGMPKVDEYVFFHKSSGSLLVSDLCFHNLHPHGLGDWLIYKTFGTHGKFAVSRLFTFFIKDKASFTQSVQKILALPIKQIIVSHGENLTKNPKESLRQAFLQRGLTFH